MDSDRAEDRMEGVCVLRITEGIGRGKTFHLQCSRQYTIGRAKECEITIGEEDRNASRRHALLTVEKGRVFLKNLSKTNPTIVDGKGVDKVDLGNGSQFQVGNTVFTVEGRDEAASKMRKYLSKPVAIAGGLVLISVAVIMLFMGESTPPENAKPPIALEEGEVEKPSEGPIFPEKGSVPRQGLPEEPISIPSGDKEKANEHFRKGMFFYDAAKLGKAIDEWDQTLVLNRNHAHARKWLLRAEDELEDMINEHYQSALVNKKYMRYAEAIRDFRIVVELSRNKGDERYINSAKQLEELEGRSR